MINRFVRFIAVAVVSVCIASINPVDAQALGLKVAPLEYKAVLTDGERKQGFIDVSNPSGQAVTVRTSVQGFKQIDDNGGLQFFSDTKLTNAVKLGVTDVALGPREALRMTFTIDGSILPKGDVFAAIFFTTEPAKPVNGVGQLVRVGTLLSLVNDGPGERRAAITDVSLPLVQLTDNAKGAYMVKNTGAASSGFYPTVAISVWPSGKKSQKESSLVFGGRERSNDFSVSTGYGIHRVEVAYGDSKRSRWVILIAPWMIILALMITAVVSVELVLLKRRRTSRRNRKK